MTQCPAACQYAFGRISARRARTDSDNGASTQQAMEGGGRSDDGRNPSRRFAAAQPRHGHCRRPPRRPAVAHRDRRRRPALSHSTISAISSDLIGEGVLAETKSGEGGALKRGRPQVAISLNPEAATVVAVVLSLNFAVGGARSTIRATRSPRNIAAPADARRCRESRLVAECDRHRDAADRRAAGAAGRSCASCWPIQGITDARRPHHAVVADHAAQRHSLRRHAGARPAFR